MRQLRLVGCDGLAYAAIGWCMVRCWGIGKKFPYFTSDMVRLTDCMKVLSLVWVEKKVWHPGIFSFVSFDAILLQANRLKRLVPEWVSTGNELWASVPIYIWCMISSKSFAVLRSAWHLVTHFSVSYDVTFLGKRYQSRCLEATKLP